MGNSAKIHFFRNEVLQMTFGREKIFTNEKIITEKNIIDVLRNAIIVHERNAMAIDFLLDYEAGNQPLQRVKNYRSDVNIEDVDNVASEISDFKLAYKWGYPITFVQRGNIDSGNDKEVNAVALLNEYYAIAGMRSKTQELARYIEIAGIGYTYVDINIDYDADEDGENSPFTIDVLDPRYTFVVRTMRGAKKEIILAVSYSVDERGNRYFTCFTKDRRYEVTNEKLENKEQDSGWFLSKEGTIKNVLGKIPIVEWIRSYDRMGCFEKFIPACDGLNIAESDFLNAGDEIVQAVWHCNDVEFPTDEQGNVIKPKKNDWLQTFTTRDGKRPFVSPLTINYDFQGNLSYIMHKRSTILQLAHVPQRNNDSGGSTGVAMSDATGWSAAEADACKDECITEGCKMEEVALVLRAIKRSGYLEEDNPILSLRAIDVQPSIERQKTYELSVKSNFIATLISHGFYGEHVIKEANCFKDPTQVWLDSKDGIIKYQESLWANKVEAVGGEGEKEASENKTSTDPLNQVSNSNRIDGMN